MIIDLIDDKQRFDALRDNWNEVYAIDTHATVFCCWGWLRGWIEFSRSNWFVLAAKPNHETPYVGFMLFYKAPDGRMLYVGGVPESDHTGMVCAPEYEKAAIGAFAEYIERRLKWEHFKLTEVFDVRINELLRRFNSSAFLQVEKEKTPCPYLELPTDWDAYLLANLSKRRRKHVRRALRYVEVDDRFRFEQPGAASLDQYIDILIALWKNRWQRSEPRLFQFFKCIVPVCFEEGILHASLLWHLDQPVAVKLAFQDHKHESINFYNGGWDRAYARLSPSIVMFAYHIRYAIEEGYRICDFLRGAERYKLKLGASIRYNRNHLITRNTLKRKVRSRLSQLKRSVTGALQAG